MEKGSDKLAVVGSSGIVSDIKDTSQMVKCVDCGFAAKRTRTVTAAHPSLTYFEISPAERQDKVSFAAKDQLGPYSKLTVAMQLGCVAQAYDLDAEACTVPAHLSDHGLISHQTYISNAKVVLEKDRPCNEWYRYSPGLSPREHLYVRMFELLQKQQREWEEKREVDRRAFEERLSARAESVQLELAASGRELQAQRDREQTRSTKLTTRITLVGAAIALAQLLTLTKDSLLWKLIAKIYYWLCGC